MNKNQNIEKKIKAQNFKKKYYLPRKNFIYKEELAFTQNMIIINLICLW